MTSLLIIDDDQSFCTALSQALTTKGYEVHCAYRLAEALTLAQKIVPELVLLDLKIPGGSGLSLIAPLLAIDPNTSIVVLTGYADIATAVEAIKLGAVHYLAKPVGTEEILAAFERKEGNAQLEIASSSRTLLSVEREHILQAFERNKRNISATARELGMHRRTLQRKLEKL